MPWLIRSTPEREVPPSSQLFFVHVPRCGGTSLMQHFDVPRKVIDARGPVRASAMRYFFHRYKTLERSNFPIRTRENAACAALLLLSLTSRFGGFDASFPPLLGAMPSTWLGAIAVLASVFTTVICTAPVIGRIMPVHRWFLWFVHYPTNRLVESIDWCTGANKHGYIMHLTAPKLLGYGYVTSRQMDTMCSLAIVRNPYSRMVSIYGYNRFGEGESFKTFVRRWKKLMRAYLEDGEKEEWYTPCHLLPMFEFTHYNGKQLVQSIVKQEELKLLKTREGAEEAAKLDSTVSDLPDLVRDALLGMPHTNKRASSTRKWYDYYDQETMDLTYEMYKMDFAVFGYSHAIEQRTDLVPPKMDRRDRLSVMKFDQFSRNSFMSKDGSKMRISQASLFGSVTKSMKTEMLRRSSTSALKQSLIQMDKDELLASVAGIRKVSTVREDSIEGWAEGSGRSKDD